MENKYYLLSLTICGIKNIEKEIRIDFYKKTIDKNFDPSLYRVKAIYGENGAGKTGIVMAVKILQQLIINGRYLSDSVNQGILDAIINKVTRELHIECEFAEYTQDHITVYKYSVKLGLNELGKYEIIYEQFQKKSGMYSSARYKTVFECSEGVLNYVDADESVRDNISKYSANRLADASLTTICFYNLRSIPFKGDSRGFLRNLIHLLIFSTKLVVNMEQHDRHDVFFLRNDLQEFLTEDSDIELNWSGLLNNLHRITGVNEQTVHKSMMDYYRNDVERLCRFLQLFKSDLVSIDIKADEHGDSYECSLLINYGAYRISLEFESNGIKKLTRLFRALDAAVDSSIVFIDEMDSNINDIYLCRIVEFFMRYGQGQLCFTTHNTSPMAVLKDNKNSIDFISNDNHIIPWRTNGNFAPDKLYKNGMIQYLPFNVEPEDFLGILGE